MGWVRRSVTNGKSIHIECLETFPYAARKSNQMKSYPEVARASWGELLAEDWGGYRSPLTIHMPIHPAHCRDFVHVDCGLNVCRRRVVANLNCEDKAAFAAVN